MHHRRGSIYIIVMATTLIVLVMGLGAIAATRLDASSRTAMREEITARRLASSAAELALQKAQNTTPWRTAAASPLFSDLPLGGGFISASVRDPVDGVLTNNTTDPIQITATGRIGSARQVHTVTATASPVYVTALSSAMHATGSLTFNSATVRSVSPLSADGNIVATSSVIKADVYAAGTITGSVYSGVSSALQPTRTMPSSDVVAQYSAMATSINYGSLASGRIRRTLLSASVNPFGTVNASGIYKIDCGGAALEIQDCRITGTLIVTNTSGVLVTNSVYMSPWEQGFPVLIVSGALTINTRSTDLIESSFQNFNPSGDPYNGVSDSDMSDRYPSILQGIVYATGNIALQQKVTVVGAIVSEGSITVSSGAVVALWRQITGAPPGFVTRSFQVDSTTWARSLN